MATPRSCLLALLLLVVVSACGEEELPPPPPPVLTVDLASTSTVYCGTNAVPIQATVTGGVPDNAEVLVDGKTTTSLSAAPFHYSFDCATKAEGSYSISVRANIRGYAFTSQPQQIVVDRTLPTVVSGPFLESETEIAKDAPIRITFSEPIRSSQVTAAHISLVTATKVLSWSTDQKVLTVTPVEPIFPPQSFLLILHEEGFQDLAGNPLAANAPKEWSWTIPTFIHNWRLPKYGAGLSSLEPPAFARDRMGRSVVAWFEYTQATGAADVYVHRSGTSGTTQLGGPLSALPDGDSWVEEVQVAVDSLDRPVVAWTERAAGELKVFVRRWNGTSWEELAGVPNPITSSNARDLTLATGNTEQPAVAWTEVDSVQQARVYVYRWSGSRWDAVATPLQARSNSANALFASLGIDGENRPVVAVTEQGSSPFVGEAVVWRLNAATWEQIGSSLRPASASANASVHRTSLALDPQGKPALAFELNTPGTSSSVEVYFSRFGDAGWSSPQLLDGPDTRWPSLGFDSTGAPWVAWEKGASASNLSVRVRRMVGNEPHASVEQAFRPLFPNGGGAPMFVVVDQQQKAAKVLTRQ
ncbi:Ig-like domain-containing protein [Hyalangium sp.]|uniref:Ig-like domain-containing protein n=1 Tax=Hyalangium sp. TaxID=2028555 RepID=UPI002D2A08A2|nr:Ig-like domain-containing protein [Hyalangium sp.]HYI00552.1 Ig-like domain-containing protein [Hyalangium sp.]